MLGRALEGVLELCKGCSRRRRGGGHAAALGGVEKQGSSSARQWKAVGALGRRVEANATQNAGGLSTAPATLHSGGGREKQRKGAGGGRKGLFCNFQKFQGPEYKTRITFKLKLK